MLRWTKNITHELLLIEIMPPTTIVPMLNG